MSEMWVDGNISSLITTTPRLNEVLPTAENKLAKDGTLTHLQAPPMQADEYDQLIDNPSAFISNVLLPRKYPYLYEDRNTAKEVLKACAEESVNNLGLQALHTLKHIGQQYGVVNMVNMGCHINTPLDHIFDFFRGFRGTLTDLRRQPEKVQAAMDALWEYLDAERVSKPYDASKGFPFQPSHIPAYLSPKQYKELCWPYQKQLVDWVYSGGGKIFMVMEGRWENILDCFLEVPKDSMVLMVDDDDILKVSSVLGDHQIICGGLKLADTRLRSFDDIKDDIKRVIDTCAPGGGFMFCTDKGLLTPGDVNRTLMECYNFAHEYSSK